MCFAKRFSPDLFFSFYICFVRKRGGGGRRDSPFEPFASQPHLSRQGGRDHTYESRRTKPNNAGSSLADKDMRGGGRKPCCISSRACLLLSAAKLWGTRQPTASPPRKMNTFSDRFNSHQREQLTLVMITQHHRSPFPLYVLIFHHPRIWVCIPTLSSYYSRRGSKI